MRVQILSLPDDFVDGTSVNRFALIVDEHPDVSDASDRKQVAEDWAEFAREIGGKGAFVTPARVDVVEHTATADMVTEIVQQLDEMIGRRVDEHAEARRADVQFRPPGGMTKAQYLQALAERGPREGGR
ncbi:hypothetical protein [Micromonospora sp. DT227]|uniref:hypothetical protein n=1 Tax=Micromonospora sp. DT227 TaxID=3393433 RepID=UPI003CF881B8